MLQEGEAVIKAVPREEFQGHFHGINFQARGLIILKYGKKMVIQIGGSSYYTQSNGRQYEPAHTILFDLEEDGLRCCRDLQRGDRVSAKMFHPLVPAIARFMKLGVSDIEDALEVAKQNKWMKTVVIDG
jgi:hypothetical protein